MTRLDLDHVTDFDDVSDDALALLLQEVQETPTIELTEVDVVEDADPLFELSEEEWIVELDNAFDEISLGVKRIERGVAYCENVECNDYLKGNFLFMHEGETFTCSTCGGEGDHMLEERGIPEREGNVPFATVRIEYCYEPSSRKYTEIAIVSDEGFQGPCGTYTVQNPLCRTSKRAIKIGEALLSIINEGTIEDGDLGIAPKSHEKVLSFDKPLDDFRQDLEELERRLSNNRFLQGEPNVVSTFSEVEANKEEGDPSGPESQCVGGTSDPEPRVSPGRTSGGGACDLHDRGESSSVGSQRSEDGLHPVLSVGSPREELHREEVEGGRSGCDREAEGELRAAGRWLLEMLFRSSDR